MKFTAQFDGCRDRRKRLLDYPDDLVRPPIDDDLLIIYDNIVEILVVWYFVIGVSVGQSLTGNDRPVVNHRGLRREGRTDQRSDSRPDGGSYWAANHGPDRGSANCAADGSSRVLRISQRRKKRQGGRRDD